MPHKSLKRRAVRLGQRSASILAMSITPLEYLEKRQHENQMQDGEVRIANVWECFVARRPMRRAGHNERHRRHETSHGCRVVELYS